MNNNSGFSGSTVLVALLAGAAAGAAVALLTAPKAGRETREELKQLGNNVARTASKVPSAMRAAYDRAAPAAVDAFKEKMMEGVEGRVHA